MTHVFGYIIIAIVLMFFGAAIIAGFVFLGSILLAVVSPVIRGIMSLVEKSK